MNVSWKQFTELPASPHICGCNPSSRDRVLSVCKKDLLTNAAEDAVKFPLCLAQQLWDRHDSEQGPKAQLPGGLFSLAVPLPRAFFTLFNSSSFWMLREPGTGNSLEIIYRAGLVDLYSRLQTHREINSFYIQNARLLLSFIAVKIYFEVQSNHHDFKSSYYKVYVTPIWPPHLSNDQTLN